MNTTDFDKIEAQLPVPETVRIWRALQSLRSVISFMNTGAHPDDETSEMLAALAFRYGLNTSYACSTRGEGGQNAIGLESGRDLGMVREAEMDLACQILNMKMYWLADPGDVHIYDFGFSKSGVDTMARWGHMNLLKEFVRVIRTERPDIICPTFLNVPGQHGHHRAMTLAAHEAFDMAANAEAFPELELEAWSVSKLYLPAWGGGGKSYDDEVPPPAETITVDATGVEKASGISWAQIGQQSRFAHKTQGMGVWRDPDYSSTWPLHLAASRVGSDRGDIRDNLPQRMRDILPRYNVLDEACDQVLTAWPDMVAMSSGLKNALELMDSHADSSNHRLARKKQQLLELMNLIERKPVETSSAGNDKTERQVRVIPDKIVVNLNRGERTFGFTTETSDGEDATVALPEAWRKHENGVIVPDDVRNERYTLDVLVDGRTATHTIAAEYSHIGTVSRQHPTQLSVLPIHVDVSNKKTGFISGRSGRPDYWMSELGMDVTALTDQMLTPGVFSEFDTILVGALGFGARPALFELRNELHDWVRAGGNLVTLYHRPWDNWDPDATPPSRVEIGQPSLRWRITDEFSEVTHLLPDHPLLNTPNKIEQQDWNDWHKERGLYFASKWSSDYKPLLSMADPDESPMQGALLSARIGKGRHTHTALILEHQMEMLVPGAFRLMANLLAGAE